MGYFYLDESKAIYHEYPDKYGQIPPEIISFDYDENFIIAKQKPKIPLSIMYKDYNYNNGYYVFYYWLIVKKEHNVFGPLDENQFSKIKEKYSIDLKCE
jgi:hypothetical protein